MGEYVDCPGNHLHCSWSWSSTLDQLHNASTGVSPIELWEAEGLWWVASTKVRSPLLEVGFLGGKAPLSILPQACSRVQNHDQDQSKRLPRQSLTNSVLRRSCSMLKKFSLLARDLTKGDGRRITILSIFLTIDVLRPDIFGSTISDSTFHTYLTWKPKLFDTEFPNFTRILFELSLLCSTIVQLHPI